MPNWCDTCYKCVGDLKEVRSLHKVLKYMNKRKTSILKNGFGKMWLGNLVHKLGGNWEELRCRGEIIDYYLDGNAYPSIKVYYMEQESGCGVFTTNDTSGAYFPERYFLETNEDWEYFETIEQVAEYISTKILNCKVEADVNAICQALDDYVEEHENENPDIFYSFHEFTIYEG